VNQLAAAQQPASINVALKLLQVIRMSERAIRGECDEESFHYAAASAIQQPEAELVFQVADLGTQGRLREVQTHCGAAEAERRATK
jgi:hypothetical protein